MIQHTDIEGNILAVDDEVYYARKRNHTANGELVKCKITSLNPDSVGLGKYQSTDPESQLIKIKL